MRSSTSTHTDTQIHTPSHMVKGMIKFHDDILCNDGVHTIFFLLLHGFLKQYFVNNFVEVHYQFIAMDISVMSWFCFNVSQMMLFVTTCEMTYSCSCDCH